MKNLQFLRKYLIIILSFIGASSLFSQFSVNLNLLPPYSPFYRDYIGYTTNNTKTIVTLTYMNPTSNAPVRVFLSASLRKDDNSITAQLKENYRPGIPIILLPNIPQTLTGAQLRNIFGNGTTNDLEMTGITTQDVVTNQAMPEGTYNICIKLKGYDTNTLLAETCRSMFIAYSEPPQIITPVNNMTEVAKNPQYVNVSWSPVTPFTQGMSYRLRMVKLLPGLSAYDAINYSTQVVLEKSNIKTTNFPLDLSSGVKLDTGSVYVLQVTGITPTAFIKNDGKSEPVQFIYKNLSKFKPDIIIPQNKTTDFTFLNPKPNLNNIPDTLKVRNDSSLLINWCWIKQINKDTSFINDKEIIENLGIQHYVLDIKKLKNSKSNPNSNQTFNFSESFQKIDSTGMIKNFVQLNDSATTVAGFEDGATYKATLSYFDANNKLLDKKTSNDFVFRKLKDAIPMVQVPVQAVLKYGFKNFPEIYPVIKTEITVEAYKEQNSKSAGNKRTGSKLNLFSELPAEDIGYTKRKFVKIASKVVTTDTLGRITTKIPIPEIFFDTDSICYRLKINNKYYVDKDFSTLTMPAIKKDALINFGQLIAKTYAYQLKLNVSKQFTQYRIKGDESGLTVELAEPSVNDFQTHYVGKDTIAPGLPVVLYRVNKKGKIPEIPTFEGNITSKSVALGSEYASNKDNITVVALGVTKLEKDSTYVTFEKLLSSCSDEKYQILAIKNLKEWLNLNEKIEDIDISFEMNKKIADAIYKATQSGTGTNFVDSAKFIAEPEPFHLPFPANVNSEDVYYRTAKANYSIISCKPPTSILRGRLFYTWKSDPNLVKRPLANTHFKVMVDYVDGGSIGKNTSIGSVCYTNPGLAKATGHSCQSTFKADNSDEPIVINDQYATMAEGMTDNLGNFKIEVVNINKKGSLGSGTLNSESSNSKPPVTGKTPKQELEELLKGGPVINTVDQSGFLGQENAGLQGSLNGNNLKVGFDAGLNSYEVSGIKNKGGVQSGGFMNMEFAPIDEYGHGPQPSTPVATPNETLSTNSSITDLNKYTDFRRTFRIVIDGDAAPYYYPSAEVIEIQPFENQSTPINITHFVREFTVLAKTVDADGGAALSEMQVTLFRGPDKPEKLPLGEGDGKYTYKELNSPVYDSINAQIETDVKEFQNNFDYSQKFEQLWPSQGVEAKGSSFGKTLPSLLQSEFDNYYVQASSYVNTGTKFYKATINEIPVFEDKTTNWANPEIPIRELIIKLQPLPSRALVRVMDGVSKKNLTTDQKTIAIFSKSILLTSNNFKTQQIDKYGYAEMIAYNNTDFGNMINSGSDSTKIYFFAVANGYKFSTQQEKHSFLKFGKQATPIISLMPKALIKGRIINADMPTNNSGNNSTQINYNLLNGVRCYLQADSGKIFETDDFGNFENIPIAPNVGTRFKIIPKDVAWFDTAYVLSVADAKKQEIDLGKISVFRRKHRL
ncbi:MAG TPA: hypothetical protein P5084_04950, partial [Paludibacter sp.]|nr:hypothetical protein [Paludibacter sp.]